VIGVSADGGVLPKRMALARTGAVLGPLLLLAILFVPGILEGNELARRALAVTALVATFWITEALPIPVTSLLPLVLFPLFGLLDAKNTADCYANPIIFLFVGGFILALALERFGLHRRIALSVVWAVGTSPKRLIFGFLCASCGIAMWISNTATTLMMLPIGVAVILQLRELRTAKQAAKPGPDRFAEGLLLGIAYASSMGGVVTKIGTAPNLIFLSLFKEQFPEAPDFGFLDWMLAFLPLCIVFIPVAWFLLSRRVESVGESSSARETLRAERKRLGPIHRSEWRVAAVFVLTVLLWVFRMDLDLGGVKITGWSTWMGFGNRVDDGTVAIFAAALLFVLPSGREEGHRLMDWSTVSKGLPWGILFLFGGGFAIARAFEETGLSSEVGVLFEGLLPDSPLLIIALVSVIVIFLTEVTSNTATTTVLMPILAAVAVTAHVNPLFLMLPACLAASYAFMLPVATPPNAIVFASGEVSAQRMAANGFKLNIAGVIILALVLHYISLPMLGVELDVVPDWLH